MSLWLFVAGYVALPLLVGFVYWRRARRLEAVLWTLACIAGPFAVFWLALELMTPFMQGESLGYVALAGSIAGIAWLWASVAGFIFTARARGRARPGEP